MQQNTNSLLESVLSGHRLSKEEGVHLLKNAHWAQMSQYGHRMRLKKNDNEHVSYTVFRLINYTNVCQIGCYFCSFKRDGLQPGSYTLNISQIKQKIDEGLTQGAFQVFFQGGVYADLPLDYYLETLNFIKQTYGCHIRGFSPVELFHIARSNNLKITDMLQMLKDAGLDSVPGAGAEILVERVRQKLSPQKISVEQWVDVLRLCHALGLKGSANIVFGSIETPEEVVEHLDVIRRLQDETGGFHAFIPWSFQAQTKDFPIRRVAPHTYLTVLALSRLYLDNIQHIEASVLAMGKQLGELALHSGANDINSPVLEENVLRSLGLKSEQQAIDFIETSGYQARKRDFDYNIIP